MAHRLLILFAAPLLLAQEFHNLTVIPNSTRTTRGALELRDQDDSAGVALRAPVSLGASYSLELPSVTGLIGDCLKVASSGVLTFGSCGATGGWTLTGSELAPSSTDNTLAIVRSIDGQNLGSYGKPWAAAFARSFAVPDAAGTGGKVTLNGTALNGYDTGGNQKVQLQFNSGVLTVWNGYIQNLGVPGSNTDAYAIAKTGTLGASNVRWVMSQRDDGRQLWFYGYDGSNFYTTLKLNPTGNSVCVGCTSDATPGYSLDVNGQILTTGLKAQGNGGYVNAAQIEVRDPATNFHWGIRSTLQTVGERSLEFRDANAVVPLKMWTMQSGGLRTAVDIYGELQTQDVIPDADAGFDSGRSNGIASRRWYEMHASRILVSTLFPKLGQTDINLAGNIVPIGSRAIGSSGARINSIHVTNLDVTTCTGCGGGSGGWTAAGATLYPTSNTSGLEVLPNPTTSPANSQSIGSGTAPWSAVLTKAVTVPHTTGAFYRSNLTAGGLTLANTSGIDTMYLFSTTGLAQNIGGYFVYNALSDFTPVVSLTTSTFSHTAYAGSGNASLCVNASGVMYRGTPGC